MHFLSSRLKKIMAFSSISFVFVTFSPKIMSLANSSINKQVFPSENLENICNLGKGEQYEECPEAAIVWKVEWGGLNRIIEYIGFNDPDKEDIEVGRQGQMLHGKSSLKIGNNISLGALMRFTRNSEEQFPADANNNQRTQYAENHLIKGYLAAVGFSSRTTEYKYPCDGVGSLTIGWEEMDENATCTVRYNPNLHKEADYYRRPLETPIGLKSKQINVPGAPVNLKQYCSVLAKPEAINNEAWGVNIDSTNDTSQEELCNQAIEECQEKAGGDCVAVEHGYWRTYHPELELRKVRLLFRCKDSERYDQIILDHKVDDKLKVLKDDFKDNPSCILSIYNRDDILIEPDHTQRTLIHANGDNNQVKITTLIGKITITQPGNPDQVGTEPGSSSPSRTIEIEAGERFTLNLSTLKEDEISLSPEKIQAVIDLPVVQAFLNEENWEQIYRDDPIKEQIKAFKDELIKAPPPKPIIEELGSGIIGEVKLPASYDENQDYPVLILLPYTGVTTDYTNPERAFAKQYQTRTNNPFITISLDSENKPSGSINTEQLCNEIRKYEKIATDLDGLMSKYNIKIDTDRVALGGSSLGGDLTWAIILRNPNLFKRAITINSRNTYRLNSCGDESINLESSMGQLAEENARFSMLMSEAFSSNRLSEMLRAVEILNQYGVANQFEEIPTEEVDRSAIRTEKMMESVDFVLFNE